MKYIIECPYGTGTEVDKEQYLDIILNRCKGCYEDKNEDEDLEGFIYLFTIEPSLDGDKKRLIAIADKNGKWMFIRDGE